MDNMNDSRFNQQTYVIRRKVLTIAGAQFHIYNDKEELQLYCKQKAFKLKEDIRLYTGEDMQEEVLTISARAVIDFSAAYDVVDTKSGVKVGALQRRGMKSILKDEWMILDANDQQIGLISEDSMGMALLRRFLTGLIPQNFDVVVDGKKVMLLKQNFNPFVYRLTVDFSMDKDNTVDRRIGMAAGLLIAAIEGRQG